TRAYVVRWETLASDFTFRRAASALPVTSRRAGSASGTAWRRGAADGHGAACTEPLRHQLHTSSVAKGRNGASSRRTTSVVTARVVRAEVTSVGVKPASVDP